MTTHEAISFPVIEVTQPIGKFYVGVLSAKQICAITYSDVRRIEREREVETYLGIQRPLSKKRAEELRQYVTSADATFPTSIIVAVDEECASLDRSHRTMTLTPNAGSSDDKDAPTETGKIAKVLDGQHRIEGLMDYAGGDFYVNVAIFVGMDIADQANVFATVNLAQTKVNKSLAYDLFGLARTRSPQKSCHMIAVMVNEDPESPFYRRIKRLGVATDNVESETLTQATFIESMLRRYISKNPNLDRDTLRRGRSLKPISSEESESLIFRNMFLSGNEVDIAAVIDNFYSAVRDRWPDAWASTGRGNILNRTNGFRGFMRFLRPAYLDLGSPGIVVKKSNFQKIMKAISLKDSDFETKNFPPGTAGEAALFHELEKRSGIYDRG